MERNLDFFGKKIKISLREDRAILLICIGIAFVFWLFTKLSKTYSTDLAFVNVYQKPDDLAFVQPPPAQLRATIQGRGWDLLWLQWFRGKKALEFSVESIQQEGINRNEILTKISDWLENTSIKVESTSFDFIPLTLEKLARKKVPVVLKADIDFAPNFNYRSPPRLSPDSVIVIGAPSLIDSIVSWPTIPIQLKNVKSSGVELVDLRAPQHPEVSVSPARVNLHLQAEAFTEKSIFVPLQLKNPPADSFTLFPKQVQIKVSVGISHFGLVNPDSFQVTMEYEPRGASSTGNRLPITIEKYPEFVQILNYTPKTAEFFMVLE